MLSQEPEDQTLKGHYTRGQGDVQETQQMVSLFKSYVNVQGGFMIQVNLKLEYFMGFKRKFNAVKSSDRNHRIALTKRQYVGFSALLQN